MIRLVHPSNQHDTSWNQTQWWKPTTKLISLWPAITLINQKQYMTIKFEQLKITSQCLFQIHLPFWVLFTNIFVWFLQFSKSWKTGLNNAVNPGSNLKRQFKQKVLFMNRHLVILIVAGAEASFHRVLDNVGYFLNIKQLLLIISLSLIHD